MLTTPPETGRPKRRWIVLAAVAIVLGFVLNAWAWNQMHRIQFGTIAEWVTGLVTAGAVILAARALQRDHVALAAQQREMEAAEQYRRTDQARHVNAWITETPRIRRRVGADKELIDVQAFFKITNSSFEPAYDIQALIRLGRDIHPMQEYHTFRTSALGPGETDEAVYRVLHEVDEAFLTAVDFESNDVECQLTFRDASGTYWERSSDGHLREAELLAAKRSVRELVRQMRDPTFGE